MPLITRYVPPNAKGFKLTFSEMDNNLYYLQDLGVSGFSFSSNTITITNPTGKTKTILINTLTGLTVNGNLTVTGTSKSNIFSGTTISGGTLYGDGSNLTGLKPYKIYTALLTQTSTNPPTSLVLENDLGDIAFTYVSEGVYTISGDTLFTENKTVIFNTQRSFQGGGNVQIYRWDVNTLNIETSRYFVNASDFIVSDDILSDTAIEIRIYN